MTAKHGKGPGPDEGQRPARRGVVLTLLGIGLVAAAYVVTIVVMWCGDAAQTDRGLMAAPQGGHRVVQCCPRRVEHVEVVKTSRYRPGTGVLASTELPGGCRSDTQGCQ